MLIPGIIANSRVAAAGVFASGTENFTITEGTSGGNNGYSDSLAIGSIAPTQTSGPFDILQATTTSIGNTFTLIISGNHISAAITNVELVNYETVTQAGDLFSYGYNGGSDFTQWVFSLAANHWNGSGTEDINITFP